jgi:hypothetical protein
VLPLLWAAPQIEKITIPLLGTFGGKDAMMGFSDPASAEAAVAKIKAAGAVECAAHQLGSAQFLYFTYISHVFICN